jgi:hypothetical protein
MSRVAALVFASEMLLGCGRLKPPAEMAGPDAGVEVHRGNAAISVARTLVIEDNLTAAPDQLDLDIRIDNGGDTAVNDVGIRTATVAWSGLVLTAHFTLDGDSDAGPIAPGDTRTLAFHAQVPRVGACANGAASAVNTGVLVLGAVVTSNVGAWSLSGIVVNAMCLDKPQSWIKCPQSVEQACSGSRLMMGAAAPACASDWQTALADLSRCSSDVLLECDGGLEGRRISEGGIDWTYFYDVGSGALVAVTSAVGFVEPTCAGGPAAGFVVPSCFDFTDHCPAAARN